MPEPRWFPRLLIAALLFLVLARPSSSQAAEQPAASPLSKTCATLCQALPGVQPSDCLNSGLAPAGTLSNAGFPLLIKEYPPLPKRTPRARVLVLSGTHGDETAGATTVFHWMRILDKHHSGLFHWKVVPLLNPDGLLKRPPTRTNGRGVDLNRNLPSPQWREIGVERWRTRAGQDPAQYPGPEPASEPETKWLVRLIQEFKPQAIITVHAPLGVVDYDGPGRAPWSIGRLKLHRLGNFPGTLGNYAGEHLKLPVVTIELPSDHRPPTAAEMSAMWSDLVRWLYSAVPASGPTHALDGPDRPAK